MKSIRSDELEVLVRKRFPAKARFSVTADLGLTPSRMPAVARVHGGPDPFLDRQLDAWLNGASAFAQLYALLNRLCRDGALEPGEYAITT